MHKSFAFVASVCLVTAAVLAYKTYTNVPGKDGDKDLKKGEVGLGKNEETEAIADIDMEKIEQELTPVEAEPITPTSNSAESHTVDTSSETVEDSTSSVDPVSPLSEPQSPALLSNATTLSISPSSNITEVVPKKSKWNLAAKEFVPTLQTTTHITLSKKPRARHASNEALHGPPVHTLADYLSPNGQSPTTPSTHTNATGRRSKSPVLAPAHNQGEPCYFGIDCHNKKCTYTHPQQECK
jgi:hypothetical protein